MCGVPSRIGCAFFSRGCAAVARVREPGAAAQNAKLAGAWSLGINSGPALVVVLVVPVLAPLGDVAVHVVEAEAIRLVGSDSRSSLQVRALASHTVWNAVGVGLGGSKRIAAVKD